MKTSPLTLTGLRSFTKTKAMKEMLAERAKMRERNALKGPVESRRPTGKAQTQGGEKDLEALVQSVKRKMDQKQKRVRKRTKK